MMQLSNLHSGGCCRPVSRSGEAPSCSTSASVPMISQPHRPRPAHRQTVLCGSRPSQLADAVPITALLGRASGERARVVCRAGGMDVMPVWTLDQIAGLAFGVVMIAFVASARQVDVIVAKAQRRQLGLCEECGGVYEPGTCPQKECPLKQGPKQ
ncbi:hypothetical protein TSOC_006761 [Tetrabaena socialis]|uniref:Uncharacterized protein n=1 Tax=Tetrabaena socialis TaxID=47790 RepID=A0A2J8A2R8_9CHLO|nr:hypothetical protein TSOC_006761 [Tetrabaena socialis]|eukprot:PNH06819.1 hypothetical protein TSOC_006761 [Tetrabaena socialis]